MEQLVKVVAFVNCTDGFSQQPQVVNGFSGEPRARGAATAGGWGSELCGPPQT